ncbi:membrane lipoprotein lipid attachment site-containing protein [Bacillus sp. Bva_UNVM-123]|uniref:stress protein n=1 Tax=Bacillus sp. Bva_UNVM-123 TaxID=2829798 RepID=UPI00391F3815
MKKIIVLLLGVFLLTACSNSTGGKEELSTAKVIEAFKEAGLEAEEPKQMTKDDYGMAPMKAKDAQIVKLPSLCDDCNARVFNYEKEKDLDQMKAYYDELGKESAMLFSWTIKHKNILVQLNGDLPEDEYNKYKEVLEGF